MPEGLPRRGDFPAAPVVYEIYPRSFFDTTGSGEGDLRGISEKLPYVADLGVDAVWIAPFFLSPMIDGGYDVQDHALVNPRFGTEADFDAMVERAHALGLKVMIDQVLNHTSHRHAWFANSVDRRGGYDDWYIWLDPKPDGTAPNNWLSQFGPPAWTWNHRREQYYFHQFLDCQPNLNLRNEEVRAALRDILRGWKARGVDGFRFDAVTSYLWDTEFKDNPPSSPEVREKVSGPSFNPYSMQDHENDLLPGDGTEWAGILREWAGEDMWLLGEVTSGNQSVELVNKLCCPEGLDAAYTVDLSERGANPKTFRDVLDRLEVPSGFAWWLSSHDQPRAATAHGDGSERDARFLLAACGLMPGPWLLYMGEELGLPQPFLDWSENDDPFDRLYWPDTPGRAAARVPIPWSEGYVGFGFTQGTPWLTMRWDGRASVLSQKACPDSVMNYARGLVALRKEHRLGENRVVAWDGNSDVLRLETEGPAGRFVLLGNFGNEAELLPDDVKGAAPVHASSDIDDDLPARTAALWRLNG